MDKISDEVINFIEKTMKIWIVELTAGGKSLAEAKIPDVYSREMRCQYVVEWHHRYYK